MVPEFVQAISALPTMWQYIFQISMMVPSQNHPNMLCERNGSGSNLQQGALVFFSGTKY